MVHGRLRRKPGAAREATEKTWHEVWICPECGSVHWGTEIFLPGQRERFKGLEDLTKLKKGIKKAEVMSASKDLSEIKGRIEKFEAGKSVVSIPIRGELRRRFKEFCDALDANMASAARAAIEETLDKYGY